MKGIPAVCHFFLLLFDGFALPTAGHIRMLPQAEGTCGLTETRTTNRDWRAANLSPRIGQFLS